MRKPRFVALFGIVAMLSLVSEAQQPSKNTVRDSRACPICTAEQEKSWKETMDFSLGVHGSDPVGHPLGNANALKTWYLVGWDTDTQHRGDEKQTLCGRLDHWDFYDGEGDEADWNNYIVPSDHYAFIINQVKHDIDGVHFIDLEKVHKCEDGKKDCLEAEITPDEHFYRNPYFDRTYTYEPAANGQLKPVVKPSPLTHQEICTYGPWVMDGNHGYRPEIHPSELYWWREEQVSGAYFLLLLQDDSNRFDRVTDYYFLADPNKEKYEVVRHPAGEWRPWSKVPRTGEFRLAFSALPGQSTVPVFTVQEKYARHVVTSKSAEFKEDSDDGTEHALEFDGTVVVQVNESQPDDDVGVRFVELCRKADGTLLGYVSLRSQVGEDDRGKEGYLVLRVDFASLTRTEAEIQDMIARSYEEAFGRTARDSEARAWSSSITSHPITYAGLVRAHVMWLGSPDGEAERGPMIARSYQEAFGRAPSDTESTSWFNFLASTAISYRDLVNAHIDWLVSPSGQVERPQVVDRSFEAVIARLPTLDERARWVARIVSERLTSKRIMALLRE